MSFLTTLVTAQFKSMSTKPFLGKPYVYYGQCLFFSEYWMLTSGVLASKYRISVAAFGDALLGMTGPEGAMETFLNGIAIDFEKEGKFNFSSTFEFTNHEFVSLLNRDDIESVSDLLLKLHYKASSDSVLATSRHFAVCGAAMGYCAPEVLKGMFDSSFAKRSEDKWKQAVEAGLAIPEIQEAVDYDNFEADTVKLFLEYVSECRPELLNSLAK